MTAGRIGQAAILLLILSVAATAADTLAGEEVFKSQKCAMCHKYVAPLPTDPPPPEDAPAGSPNLWNVGDHRDPEWITKWMKKEIDIEGRKHKKVWKGSDGDLKTLVEWLLTLKSPVPEKADEDSTKKVTTEEVPAPQPK